MIRVRSNRLAMIPSEFSGRAKVGSLPPAEILGRESRHPWNQWRCAVSHVRPGDKAIAERVRRRAKWGAEDERQDLWDRLPTSKRVELLDE
jgi:hypothetical protein